MIPFFHMEKQEKKILQSLGPRHTLAKLVFREEHGHASQMKPHICKIWATNECKASLNVHKVVLNCYLKGLHAYL